MSVENKKCPHCGAELEENARFCLYCMTSLDEKERVGTRLYLRKRWLILSAAFFALLLVGGGLLLVFGKPKAEEKQKPSDLSTEQQTPSENGQADDQQVNVSAVPQQEEHSGAPSGSPTEPSGPTVPEQGGSSSSEEENVSNSSGNTEQSSSSPQTQGENTQTPSGSSQTQGGTTQTSSGSSQTQGGTTQTPSGSSQTQGGTTQTPSGSSQTQGGITQMPSGSSQTQGGTNEGADGKGEQSNSSSQPSQTPSDENSSEESAPEQSTPSDAPAQQQPEQTAPTFTYRQMKYGDDYHTNAAVTEDKIVLTGIQTPASDGIYHIPATIDGKTVIAIEGQAFYNSGHALTIKKIYIPSTLKTIWGSAFVGCYNLTDVYLYGKSIYIDPWAFPTVDKRNGTLTLHCSSDCSNRDFRYYKNIASSYYDAEYVEWNG